MRQGPILLYGADDWGSDSEGEYEPGTPSPRKPPHQGEKKETIIFDKRFIIGFILGYLFHAISIKD